MRQSFTPHPMPLPAEFGSSLERILMDATQAKDAARRRALGAHERLIGLSRRIHANPELGFAEEQASAWVAETLGEAGFVVERGVHGLPTALVARAGSGPLKLAVCAEYDALPRIGHACGHNIIAASAVGAGIALAEVADDVGVEVTVVGTPAEEGGGGKVLLLERGAFAGFHAAMMVHPAAWDTVEFPIIASSHFKVGYSGKESHAAAAPELGVNAADALVVAQTAIGLLRQHLRRTDFVHGIVTRGGDAPNVVPARTEGTWMVRARTLDELAEAQARVERCFQAGALATGATLELTHVSPPYAELRPDPDLNAAYRRNAEALGRTLVGLDELPPGAAGSTDMGNVSLVLPSIHPMIGIGSLPAVNHQPEFTACCATGRADQAVMDGAIGLAWTAIDAAADERLRSRLLTRAGPAAAQGAAPTAG